MNTRKRLTFEEFEKISNYDWLQRLKTELQQTGKELAQDAGVEAALFYTLQDMDEKTALVHRQFINPVYKHWTIDEAINFNSDFVSKIQRAIQGGTDGISLILKKELSPEDAESIHEASSSIKFMNFNFTEGTEIT